MEDLLNSIFVFRILGFYIVQKEIVVEVISGNRINYPSHLRSTMGVYCIMLYFLYRNPYLASVPNGRKITNDRP